MPSYDQTDEDEEGNQWAKLAVAIDKVARRLIGFSLNQAVIESQLHEDPWLDLAKDLAPDSHVQLLIQLSRVDQKTSEELDGEAEEELEEAEVKAFSDELKWLVKLSEQVEEILANAEKP